MAEQGRFDWPALMRLGQRGLGLSPETFWSLTPAELMLKLGLEAGQAPMGRARLEELAQAFPDRVANTGAVPRKGEKND